jgi:hypothetical protein
MPWRLFRELSEGPASKGFQWSRKEACADELTTKTPLQEQRGRLTISSSRPLYKGGH